MFPSFWITIKTLHFQTVFSLLRKSIREKHKAAVQEVKYTQKDKFQQVLVWCAIPSKSNSDVFIKPSKRFAMNSGTYIRHCPTKLKKFIEPIHKYAEIIFWPALRS